MTAVGRQRRFLALVLVFSGIASWYERPAEPARVAAVLARRAHPAP